jgi:hypothetical protein
LRLSPHKLLLCFCLCFSVTLIPLLSPPGLAQDGKKTPGPGSPPNRQIPEAKAFGSVVRAALLVEDPNERLGKRNPGTANWSTRPITTGAGALAAQAEIEIPDQHLKMLLSVVPNRDQSPSASFTVDIVFTPLLWFLHGNVSALGGITMKSQEMWRGDPLTGRVTKITPNSFRIALSGADSENRDNLKLLEEEAWLDLPIVFGDGLRAIVSVEKGAAGRKAIADILVAGDRNRDAERPGPAPRAILYEEDQKEGVRHAGVVRWRTRRVMPVMSRTGADSQLAVQAEIEIPEGQLKASLSMLPNDDPTFPASHVVEVTFVPLAGFAHGGVSSLAGILMKQQETSRGAPLAVQAARTVPNSFLVALSLSEKQRNLTLLKENAWISFAIVFGDGRRSIVVIEKGAAGDKAFSDAFAKWN